ncbi:MAG: LUD domain-containing protein, partial [Hymenobacteraceae bacterium]|nr:LUD domain-containing protein [Hymenobacteraceae bacterium]
AHCSQVVADIRPALELMQRRYGRRLPSMLSLITGPSRTADIEKTLVLGAHGPRQLVVFLLDDELPAVEDNADETAGGVFGDFHDDAAANTPVDAAP